MKPEALKAAIEHTAKIEAIDNALLQLEADLQPWSLIPKEMVSRHKAEKIAWLTVEKTRLQVEIEAL